MSLDLNAAVALEVTPKECIVLTSPDSVFSRYLKETGNQCWEWRVGEENAVLLVGQECINMLVARKDSLSKLEFTILNLAIVKS